MAEEKEKIKIIPYCSECGLKPPEPQPGVVYSPTLCDDHRKKLLNEGIDAYQNRQRSQKEEK